jgi:hypothetical protein
MSEVYDLALDSFHDVVTQTGWLKLLDLMLRRVAHVMACIISAQWSACSHPTWLIAVTGQAEERRLVGGWAAVFPLRLHEQLRAPTLGFASWGQHG